MLPGFLLALREGVEAALVVGIVLGVLRKLNRPELKVSVWLGVAAAFLASLALALGLRLFDASLEGHAEEIFEGVSMWLAAGVLTWMIFWMSRQSRSHRADLETQVRRGALSLNRWPLFGIAFLAVFREGIELALFLLAAGMAGASGGSTLLGAALGLLAAAALGWALFSSTRRLPLGRFFQVTNILLILFAAGLFAHGMHEFNEAGLIPAVVENVYNLNPLLADNSVLGGLLTAMFGYNGNPSLTEMIAYLSYFITMFVVVRLLNTRQPQSQAA